MLVMMLFALVLPLLPPVTTVPALITSEPLAASATVVVPTPFGVASAMVTLVGVVIACALVPVASSFPPPLQDDASKQAPAAIKAAFLTASDPVIDALVMSPSSSAGKVAPSTNAIRV